MIAGKVLVPGYVLLAIAAMGCEGRVIQPTVNLADFQAAESKLPGTIILYLPQSFVDDTPVTKDLLTFRKWEFRIAAPTRRALRYALEAHIENVRVSYEEPGFPLQNGELPGPILALVKLSLREFKTKQPYLIGFFEGYRVRMTLGVQLLAREGNEIFARSYKGSGATRFFAILRDDVGHYAYRSATETAVREVVDQASADIVSALRKRPSVQSSPASSLSESSSLSSSPDTLNPLITRMSAVR